MHLRKTMLLAVAVLAVAAFVAPGIASAVQFTDNGKVVENAGFEETGYTTFTTMGSSIKCTLHDKIAIKGSKAEVVSWKYTPSTCTTTGTFYKGCKAESITATSLPWAISFPQEGEFTFTGHVDFKFSGCELGETDTTTTVIRHPTNSSRQTAIVAAGMEEITTTSCTSKLGKFEETGEGETEVLGTDYETYEVW